MREHPTARLLVEGSDDFHVVHALCKQFGIDVRNLENPESGLFNVKDCKGIDKLLEMIPTQIKVLDKIAVIIDADNEAKSNWQSVRDRFQKIGYHLPEKLDRNGCVHQENEKTIGIWIMPDNGEKGMLEDFIKFLVPGNDVLLPKAQQILTEIETGNINPYADVHKPKVLIHTWLAWQERPGTPLGQAITAKYLTTENKELCEKFINWIKMVFEIK